MTLLHNGVNLGVYMTAKEVALDIMREAEVIRQIMNSDDPSYENAATLMDTFDTLYGDLNSLNLPKLVERHNRRGRLIEKLETQVRQANRRTRRAQKKTTHFQNLALALAELLTRSSDRPTMFK